MNWFRSDADGKFLWPGYGENVRVLKWMLDRIEGRAGATETPIGCVPTPSSLTLDGLSISRGTLEELLAVNPSDWTDEEHSIDEFFAKFGDTLPEPIRKEQKALAERLLGREFALGVGRSHFPAPVLRFGQARGPEPNLN